MSESHPVGNPAVPGASNLLGSFDIRDALGPFFSTGQNTHDC